MLGLPEVESVPSYVLDRTGRLARGLGAQVNLFSCIYDPVLARSGQGEANRQEQIASRVEQKQRRLERLGDVLRDQDVDVRVSVRWDWPIYEAVVRHALHSGAGLVVIPAGRLGHAGPVALTYTDARLIEACPVPLLLLKTEQVYGQGPIVAAVDPGHAHEKTVELDDEIVATAKTLSSALADTAVQIYHAVAPPSRTAENAEESTEDATLGPVAQEAQWNEREEQAHQLAQRHDVADERVFLEAGAVENTLPAYAAKARASAVVMGAVSRGYPDRVLFGYTAEKVLDALGCDVLVVKPKGFRTPVPRRPPAARRPKARASKMTAAAS